MKAVYTVGLRRWQPGARDERGNAQPGYAPTTDLPVYAIYPSTSTEPTTGRQDVVTGMTLLAPTGTLIGPQDLVVIDGETWQVEGDVADWSRGPFGWAPGVSINLTRAEG